jgi:hypothetical protein
MLPSLLILAGGGAVDDLPDLHMSPWTAREWSHLAGGRASVPQLLRAYNVRRTSDVSCLQPLTMGNLRCLDSVAPWAGCLAVSSLKGAKENKGGLLTGGGGF